MTNCLICKNEIRPVVSFGRHPLANGFLTPAQFATEYFFDLKVCFCSKCTLLQLAEQPKPELMFNDHYAFYSGTSHHMELHFKAFADEVRRLYLKASDPFVVEIGSNDGILLKNFAEAGIRHLGIEPSANVAEVAKHRGIRTICQFFNAKTAKQIADENGQADAILAANVMCHIPYLHTVIEGFKVLLKPKGIVAFEDPYLGEVIEKTAYDQIYDEHVFLFSASSIQSVFLQHGFELIDVIPQPTHGGSMRYILAQKASHPVSPGVQALLLKEKAQGLLKIETYEKFRRQCERSRDELIGLLKYLRAQGKRVVGYAATSKSTTVINYCGITPELVEFISDTTPIKQGKFSPGMHIPVLPPEKFREKYPDYALLFGWNHRAEILAKEKHFTESGGKWILFVPTVEII